MRMIREIITLSALVVLLAISLISLKRQQELTNALDRSAVSIQRAQIHDRLMGTTVALKKLLERHQPDSRPTLLWLLDLDRCRGCFDSVGDWSRLESLVGHDLILVLTGEQDAGVEARLRALARTSVVTAPRLAVTEEFGELLPNTKMLVDKSGTVILIDSRTSGQECGWKFESQVGALKGLNTGAAIRIGGEELTSSAGSSE